ERFVGPGPQLMPCLVVRLRHEVNQPVWVDLENHKGQGQEHRFYDEAGKATASFWPVSQKEIEARGFVLAPSSLETFKANATHHCRNGDFKPALGTPVPGEFVRAVDLQASQAP